MEALETIRDTDVDREATFEAGVYLSQMGSFSFVLILLVLIDIFKITTPLSKYLQSTNIDFVQAIGFVNMAIDSLNEMRTEGKVIIFDNNFQHFIYLGTLFLVMKNFVNFQRLYHYLSPLVYYLLISVNTK